METRVLQIAVVLGALVPIYGGAVGVLHGARAFGLWPGAAADSQTRYLSGLLLAIGLAYWACVPTIARRSREIRLLTFVVLIGGLSRLAGVFLAGPPGRMGWTLAMELAVAPAICLWQARVAADFVKRTPRRNSGWSGAGRPADRQL
jgi:hypothetical protein